LVVKIIHGRREDFRLKQRPIEVDVIEAVT